MTANIDPTKAANSAEVLDLSAMPEAQRVAFYGAMFAVAAADGAWGQEELDLIFQNIQTDGIAERSRQTIWEYMLETPALTDCLASFATSHEDLRCTIMLYLIEIALADRILAAGEDKALLEARTCLRISQKQMEAVERYICNVGLVRARPRDYNGGATSSKCQYGVWLVGGVGLTAIALSVSGLIGGLSPGEMLAGSRPPGSGQALLLGAGAAALIGTAAVVTARWLYARYQRNRLPIAGERRRRAQACVRNLQDAVSYLMAKAKLHAVVGDPSAPDNHTSLLFAERLWMLQRMLARRQPNAPAVMASRPEVPRLPSR